MNPESVLVTGAAGSVGHFLVEHLLKEGYRVIASDLPNAPLPKRKTYLSIRPADLTDPAAPAKLAKGANLVVHTAALIDIALPFERLEAVNLTATKALYEAARLEGVRRFVCFSTGAAYQPHPSGIYQEDMPLEAGNDYVKTKILCEEYLHQRSQTGGPEVVIIRPSLIYGPRGKMLGAAMACIGPVMHEYLPAMVGIRGGPRSNWVHAEDVARAVVHLAKHGKAGEAYNVCDDDAIPFGDALTLGVEAYGFKTSFQVPYPSLPVMRKTVPLLERAGFLFNGLNRFFAHAWGKICTKYRLERELHPKLDREALVYAYQDTMFDNHKLKSTDFELKYPSIRNGLGPTIEWYQQHRWVPTYPSHPAAPSS